MQTSQIPTKFPIPFANNAGAGFIRPIPQAHQAATSSDAPASLYDGFPTETFAPVSSGGIPPAGEDFNGILNQITAWARWLSAGVPAQFDSAFASAIGGYPKFTILASATPGKLWQSTAENNATDPDGGSAANWQALTTAPSGNDNILYHADGKLEQWGYVALSSTGEPAVAVSLLTPFANAAYNVSVTPYISSPTNLRDTWIQIIHNTKTVSGFSTQYQIATSHDTPGLDGFEWRCIGRAP
jgi:hypothetical protein